jgi:hypothetical protein
MNNDEPRNNFKMEFDIGTIKHLGLQMYSTLPPVIAELVSNAWDADAPKVEITIPTVPLTQGTEIVIRDYGSGMSDDDVRKAYFIVGRDKRLAEHRDTTDAGRKVHGRKGIGKFSAFGIANKIEVETVKNGETSHFVLDYEAMERAAGNREIEIPPLSPTNTIEEGTKVTLKDFRKFKNRSVDIKAVRRALARRFSIIGEENKFEVIINGEPITPEERDLTRLLDKDLDGNLYIWRYDDIEISLDSGWTVSGWIGALDRTTHSIDGIERGIVLMARGKLVQEPFVFDAVVGQQYFLSYIVGELHAEFVDEAEDTISTTRNSLVWDTEANRAFKEWGQKEVNRIARQWAQKRRDDNLKELSENPIYKNFVDEAEKIDNRRLKSVADKLVKSIVNEQNPLADTKGQETVVQFCIDFMRFDSFQELAEEIRESGITEVEKLLKLFREWEIVEAKEMMRVTQGRITTIDKLDQLIRENALEVPTLHKFLKEFPWVLDPRWSLIDDEVRFSDLLRENFPEPPDAPFEDRRIDFLSVKEGTTLVVVEIKRPHSKVSDEELTQLERYVSFMRDYTQRTTDPDLRYKDVVGYLLCGTTVNTYSVNQRIKNFENSGMYIRKYGDLLSMVESLHREFLDRYKFLRDSKAKSL